MLKCLYFQKNKFYNIAIFNFLNSLTETSNYVLKMKFKYKIFVDLIPMSLMIKTVIISPLFQEILQWLIGKSS